MQAFRKICFYIGIFWKYQLRNKFVIILQRDNFKIYLNINVSELLLMSNQNDFATMTAKKSKGTALTLHYSRL